MVCKSRYAFTLAEVLITLGIIGVVAAMTMPSLIANHQKKKAVSQLKKSYSVVTQTIRMAENDHGPVIDWAEWNDAEAILNKYFLPYLNGAVIYPPNSNVRKTMCYDSTSIIHSNDTQYNWLSNIYIQTPFIADNTASIKLADGSCIGINNTTSEYPMHIFIDINGSQAKQNMAGKDLFFFYINKQGFVKPRGDDWTEEELSSSTKQNACNMKAPLGGLVCSARIMGEGWEINYW